mgnify:FL=1
MNNPANINADSYFLLRRTFADDQPSVQILDPSAKSSGIPSDSSGHKQRAFPSF